MLAAQAMTFIMKRVRFLGYLDKKGKGFALLIIYMDIINNLITQSYSDLIETSWSDIRV